MVRRERRFDGRASACGWSVRVRAFVTMKIAIAAAVLSTSLVASDEPHFRDATATHLPAKDTVGRNSMDVEAADLDGDGDLDLVVAQEFLPNKLLRNEGGGRFVDASDWLPKLDPERLGPQSTGHDSEDVSVADFDGDGRLDIVFVSEDDILLGRSDVHEYYRGVASESGGVAFERVFGVLPDSIANAVAHADVNGDGKLDLFVAGAGQDRLLINSSKPGEVGFADESAARLPREAATTQDAQFADLDGDRDLDLVLAFEGGHALWLNDGKGHFTDATCERLPFVADLVEARKITPFDVDGDGDLDLYFAHVGWQGRAPQDRLFLNDGKGLFSDATAAWLPVDEDTTVDAQFADLDGDGQLEVVLANLGPLRVLTNTGAKFEDATERFVGPQIVAQQLGVELADFDGDGRLDLYLACLAGPNKDARSFDRLFLTKAE
jgi:hypothetical protein